jgi:hypothetical protein
MCILWLVAPDSFNAWRRRGAYGTTIPRDTRRSYEHAGSGLLENDSPFQIGALEKEAQASIMHKG